MLGGLVQAPSRLAPNRNLPAAQARAAQVLAAMQELGFVPGQDVKVALAQPAKPANARGGGSANYVADLVMDVLDDYVGKFDDRHHRPRPRSIRGSRPPPNGRSPTNSTPRGPRFNVGQGALVVDAARRRDPRADRRPRLRAEPVQPRDHRQAPARLLVQALRLPRRGGAGATPDTVREDAPIRIGAGPRRTTPADYEGPVTLRTALAQSLNTVAVRLGQEVGPKAVVQTAQRLGITSPLQANGSIALGTSEVTPARAGRRLRGLRQRRHRCASPTWSPR